MIEVLELRQLLSASFSNADLTGPWGIAAMGAGGTVIFNGAGAITGGSATNADGSAINPVGAYSVTAAGKTTAIVGKAITGAMNAARDVVGMSATGDNHLTILVHSGAGTFSNADVVGTWDLFTNGDKPDGSQQGGFTDNSGRGTFTFDGAGHMSGTFVADQSGRKETLSGTYAVSADGSFSMTVMGDSIFVGRINASKNLVAANPQDLAASAGDNESRLVTLVRRAGKYSNASLNGAWTLLTDVGTGTMTFDGAGHFAGTLTAKDGKQTFSGTYVVAGNGTFSASAITKETKGTSTAKFGGVISATHDVAFMDKPNAGADGLDDLAMLVASVRPNHVPTLTTIKTLKTAQGGKPFTITYAALAAAANEADGDGDAIAFRVDSVKSGKLTKGGAAVHAGVTTLAAGEELVWTPVAGAKGEVVAFGVTADDGTARSKPTVLVKVLMKK